MTRGPWLFVTVDEAHGLALVRGEEAGRVALLVSPDTPRWSRRGRGWVIAASRVADVLAYAQTRHEVVVISHRDRRGDAA